MQVRLDKMEKENEDLKKNQSALNFEVQYLKNTCIIGNKSSMSTGDSAPLSNLKSRLDDWERNQTANLNFLSTLNASIESLKFLEKASAAVVSSLQKEQIGSNLLISGLQQNLSNAETKLASLLTTLNNSLETSLQGEFPGVILNNFHLQLISLSLCIPSVVFINP